MKTSRIFFAAAVLLFAARSYSQQQTAVSVIAVEHGPNVAEQQSKPYVVLVSLDGYRYDYPRLDGATHLEAIGERGASAPEGMIPAYPSITFPNHYTIVTGLYPEHHGIVANRFYDPARKKHYSSSDPATVTDGSWYGGVPLWSLAEKQGMRSACFFWPGSEAEIAGERPSYYLKFVPTLPDEERIQQVIEWLKLPAEKRPHFITLYFGSVDHAGHEYGPDAPETKDAARLIDQEIGTLESDLSALHLRIDLVIVADHGMETVEGNWIDLERFADLSKFETDGPLLYSQSEKDIETVYAKLHGASDKFEVYRRAQFPAELHFRDSDRAGDPIVVPTGPYLIRAHSDGRPDPDLKGNHGYDPYKMKSMRAIFFAEGPDIKPGTKLAPFEDVNVYSLIAKILGLQTGKIDGNLSVLQAALQTSPTN